MDFYDHILSSGIGLVCRLDTWLGGFLASFELLFGCFCLTDLVTLVAREQILNLMIVI